MTRPDTLYAKRAVRAAVREALWASLLRHEQGAEPNILLFATRRGGSTFAMEIIAANRGVRPMNQPLETQSRNLTLAQALEIPRFRQGQITSLTDTDAPQMRRLVERIFDGEIVINAPTKLWNRDVDIRSDRLVLKLTDCKPVIDWFDQTFNADIVYLTRHPIPQSLSCIRNRWTLTVDAHLQDPAFVEAHLDSTTEALAHDVMSSGDQLQQFVLNWVLENVAPMRLLPERPDWVHVRYEDTVSNPHGVFEQLASRLRLTDRDRMEAVLSRPSQSSRRSTEATRRDIESGQGASTLARWQAEVGPEAIAGCDRVLDAFGIDRGLLESPHQA